jgi:hypothetical protein
MRSFDSVQFDNRVYTLLGNINGPRVWHTEEGDVISLYYCNKPPEIPADIHRPNDLRAAYGKSLHADGFGLVDIETPLVDGLVIIRMVYKSPQQPSGMTYFGTLTIPLRDFSYILKVQCAEQGETGLREAYVRDTLITSGEIDLALATVGSIPGWIENARNTEASTLLMRNRSEDDKYDSAFPDHPLSRLRTILGQIQQSLTVADCIKQAVPYVYKKNEDRRAWWARW